MRPIGTVTLLFSDIEGSTRLLRAVGVERYERALQQHRQLLRDAIARHAGYEVDTKGDSFFVAFGRVLDAVHAALDAQYALAGHEWADSERVRVRIGIHTCEATVIGSDYLGMGVHRTARICASAHGDQIVLSQTTHDLLEDECDIACLDLGVHPLKDFAQPQRLYQLVDPRLPQAFPPLRTPLDGPANSATPHATDIDDWGRDPQSPQVQEVLRALGAILTRQHATQSETAKSESVPSAPVIGPARVAICVLPFANMSGDPEQEHFSDGITEDIITELSRWRLLAVRPRSASFQYRGVAVDMKQVARELNVRYIVQGSVRRMDGRIRISAQLIDTEIGSHIWGEKFDRELAGIFTVQDHVVQTIVSTLVGRVQVSDVERARRKPPASLAAYECVLKANALPWDDPDGAAEATRLIEKAIEIDPDYGFAHALLAFRCYGRWYDDPSDSDAWLREAHVLAKRAVELDENESTCFSALANVCLLRRSFDQALQYARRAIELNPTNQWNRADIGSILNYVGQAEDALVSFKHAREIDPYFDPPWYWRSIGLANMILHRYKEALAMFDHLPARQYRIAALMAGCHARLGDMDSARASVAECLDMKPDFSIRFFMSKEPFKFAGDATHLAESLQMAGLPD